MVNPDPDLHGLGAAPPPPAPPPPPPPIGAYRVWTADKDGNFVGDPTVDALPDPSNPAAVDIYFGLLSGQGPTPRDQVDLQAAIDTVLSVVRKLYLSEEGTPRPQFRLHFTRIFRLAQLGLENAAAPDIAKAALDQLVIELINSEGAIVKNKHLMALGRSALELCAGFIFVYFVIAMLGSWANPFFAAIDVNPLNAKSFMMLWTGCFAGVWLSYGIRSARLTVRDLVITDSDRLFPLTRLIFAGLLTMALGLLIAHKVFDLTLGGVSISHFVESPSLALLLGMIFGVSELTLPTAFARRASDFATKLSV